MEDDWISGEEDVDQSAKDRVLSVKLPSYSFDPLMQALKETRPLLHRTLQQHSMITGKVKVKKRQNKKSRKKEKREREEKELKDAEDLKEKIRNISSSKFHGQGVSSWDTYRQILAVIVSRSIAEGSVQGVLIAVSICLFVMKDRSPDNDCTIPVGNILGTIFEGMDTLPDASEPFMNDRIRSPFNSCLHVVREDSVKGVSYADFSRADAGSQGTADDGQGTEDNSSQHGLQSEEAGSTVGSSTFAEQGTETASLTDAADLEEDVSEEELLAQAMALSLGGTNSTENTLSQQQQQQAIGTSGANRKQETPHGVLSQSSLSHSLYSGEPDHHVSGIGTGSIVRPRYGSQSAVTASTVTRDAGKRQPQHNVPAKFPSVPPLSTFGQFCDERFWRTAFSTDGFFGSSTSVHLRHTIVALLTYIGISADLYLDDNPLFIISNDNTTTNNNISNTEPTNNKENIASSDGNSNNNNNVIKEKKRMLQFPLVTFPIVPHTVTFLLLEMLLDNLIIELKKSSETSLSSSSTGGHPSTKNVKDTVANVIQDTNSASMEMNNSQHLKWSDTEYDLSAHRTFLVWCINIVLKVLRVNFSSLESTKISPHSIGLGLSSGENNIEKEIGISFGLGSTFSPNETIPFIYQLLHRVSECMGTEVSPIRCDNVVDVALLGSGSEKMKILPAYNLATDKLYRHTLRLEAIEAYVAGFAVFYPSVIRRERLLKSLLLRCPEHPVSRTVLGIHNVEIDPSSSIQNVSFGVNESQLLQLTTDYYRLLMLQKVCTLISDNDLLHVGAYKRLSAVSSSTLNASSLQTRFREQVVSSVLDKAYDEESPASPPSSRSLSSTPRSSYCSPEGSLEAMMVNEETMRSNNTHGLDNNVSNSNLNADSPSIFKPLEELLIIRLSKIDIMKNSQTSFYPTELKQLQSKQHRSMDNFYSFYGELTLLRYIQQRYTAMLTSGPSNSTQKCADFQFNPRKCSSHLIISGTHQRTVTQKNSKSWGSAVATRGCEPGTGIHEWTVRLDKCERGDLFLGVCTSEFSVDTYVGGDRYSWGVIGSKSIWHNQIKIRFDYGVNFTTVSYVTLTLDTDKGTLSYSSDSKEFGIAFDSLPNETLYPAVALYAKDDAVTFISPTKVSKQSQLLPVQPQKQQTSDESESKVIPGREIVLQTLSFYYPFVKYCKSILSVVDNILTYADNLGDRDADSDSDKEAKRNLSLCHPFIGAIFPSLAAVIVYVRIHSQIANFLSIQLLPLITVVAKRLASLHEKYGNFLNNIRDDSGFIGGVEGIWSVKSRTNANSTTPAHEYQMQIEVNQQPEMTLNEKEESLIKNASLSGRLLFISGKGLGGLSTLSTKGVVFGTRIKYQENWSLGSSNVVEARFSLDGLSFHGFFHDTKSTTTGTIEGSKISFELNNLHPKNILLKSAIYAAMAFGRLGGAMIMGFDSISIANHESEYDEMIMESNAMMSSDKSTPEEKHMVVDDAANDVAQSADPVNEDDSKEEDGKMEVDATSSPTEELKAENESSLLSPTTIRESISKWLNTILFSGGLPLNSQLVLHIKTELDIYSVHDEKNMIDSSISALDEWWLDNIFPFLDTNKEKDVTEMKLSSETDGSTSQYPMLSPLLNDLIEGKGKSKSLDDFLLIESGQNVISRIGGESLQCARRMSLATLILHSGFLPIFEAEVHSFASYSLNNKKESLLEGCNVKNFESNAILIDIWRASKNIIEHVVWLRQQTGISYINASQELCKKAELLLSINPSEACSNVGSSVAYRVCAADSNSKQTASSAKAQQVDISKIIAEIVEFMKVPSHLLSLLRNELMKAAFKGACRIAGFRAYQIMLMKVDDTVSSNNVRFRFNDLPAMMQPAALEYLLPALIGVLDYKERMLLIKPNTTENSSSNLAVTSHSSASNTQSPSILSQGSSSMESLLYGHYMSGLTGCSIQLINLLRLSVEVIYRHATQLIDRCNYSKDRDVQCVALSSWGLNIQPEDHEFLNRVGIFKVLQSVMDDVRTSMTKNTIPLGNISDAQNNISLDIVNNSNKRLAQLVLKIVHALAAQVAGGKAIPSSRSLSLRSVRSGPETLSKSLFDMLFSELHFGFRNIVVDSSDQSNNTLVRNKHRSKVSTDPTGQPDSIQEEFVDGEMYVYRVLRLLNSVSSSSVCLTYLSSPKWMTLFLLCVGYGGLAVQRRLLRLLRHLLSSAVPEALIAYVGSLFSHRREILDGEPVGDSDARRLCQVQLEESPVPVGQRIAALFLEGVTTLLPIEDDKKLVPELLLKLKAENTDIQLACESISILRQLSEIPGWRPYVFDAIVHNISRCIETYVDSTEKMEGDPDLKHAIASIAIIGGHIDRLHPGCMVLLRPLSLAAASDPYATRLTAASQSLAKLVTVQPASKAVEVVWMLPGRNNNRGNGNNANAGTSVIQGNSAATPAIVCSPTTPARTAKISEDDVRPTWEVPVTPEIVQATVVERILEMVDRFSLPWMCQQLDLRESSPGAGEYEHEEGTTYMQQTEYEREEKENDDDNNEMQVVDEGKEEKANEDDANNESEKYRVTFVMVGVII